MTLPRHSVLFSQYNFRHFVQADQTDQINLFKALFFVRSEGISGRLSNQNCQNVVAHSFGVGIWPGWEWRVTTIIHLFSSRNPFASAQSADIEYSASLWQGPITKPMGYSSDLFEQSIQDNFSQLLIKKQLPDGSRDEKIRQKIQNSKPFQTFSLSCVFHQSQNPVRIIKWPPAIKTRIRCDFEAVMTRYGLFLRNQAVLLLADDMIRVWQAWSNGPTHRMLFTSEPGQVFSARSAMPGCEVYQTERE